MVPYTQCAARTWRENKDAMVERNFVVSKRTAVKQLIAKKQAPNELKQEVEHCGLHAHL